MIYLKSMLKCIDNSGATMVECIKVLRHSPKSAASIGDKIVCVVQRARPSTITQQTKVKRGDIVHGVVVRTRSPLMRPDGSSIRFDDNAVVLVNKAGEPIGSRVTGVVGKEVREAGFNKVVSLASKVI